LNTKTTKKTHPADNKRVLKKNLTVKLAQYNITMKFSASSLHFG
jgi:hypothetical protein